jgi:hypothetical protein
MPAGAVVVISGQNQSQAFARSRLALHREAGPLIPTAHLRTEQDAQHDATIVVAHPASSTPEKALTTTRLLQHTLDRDLMTFRP